MEEAKKRRKKKKSNACGDRSSNVAHTRQRNKPPDQNRRTRCTSVKIMIYKPMAVIVYCLNLVSKFTSVLVDPGTDTKILVDAATGTGRCG